MTEQPPRQLDEYRPDVAIPPGETIAEMLQELGMSRAELAGRIDWPLNEVNEIINGKRAITPETARKLELVLGLPAQFWMSLETNYRSALMRPGTRLDAGPDRVSL